MSKHDKNNIVKEKAGIEMLRENSQICLSLSPFRALYDIVVPKDHMLRKIKDNIDFNFVNPMLRKQYSERFGRPATEPELMFKLMFLKKLYDLSDVELISSSGTDMAFKYFLDLDPEAELIDPSLMAKFRKTRITEDILEDMLKETIRQAIEKGVLKSGTIIVDSTHTDAAVRPHTVVGVLRQLTRRLRREIYRNMYDLSEKFPEKPAFTADVEEELEYTRQLLEVTAQETELSGTEEIRELHARIKKLLDSGKIREIRSKDDEDAKFGHKNVTQKFFGYKNHIAMTEERIISGIEVSDGAQPDVAYLEVLTMKSKQNGITVKEIVGDTAYVSRQNLEYCENQGIELIAKTNPAVAAAAESKDDGFVYNKDAGTLQCPTGELAMSVEKRKAKNGNDYYNFAFPKVVCRKCPLRATCRVGSSKERRYNLTIPNEKNRARLEYERSEVFRERAKLRQRVEEKHSEMKLAHGLRRADSPGLRAMRLQMFFTAFTVNVKRIVKLSEIAAA